MSILLLEEMWSFQQFKSNKFNPCLNANVVSPIHGCVAKYVVVWRHKYLAVAPSSVKSENFSPFSSRGSPAVAGWRNAVIVRLSSSTPNLKLFAKA